MVKTFSQVMDEMMETLWMRCTAHVVPSAGHRAPVHGAEGAFLRVFLIAGQ